MEVTALAACGAHWECARPVWDPIQVVAWMGHLALDVRLWCDVCLVLGSDYRHSFIKWIGVATVVAKMLASDYLMYYFVRFLWLHASSRCRGHG